MVAALCFKVTVQFERCFRLMEHISVISCRNPINLYITEKLIKFSKSLFYFHLVITQGWKAPESRFRLCFFLLFVVFWISWAVTQPKLGYWGWVLKWKFCCTIVIKSHCVWVELEDIDQERLDIDVFWLFSFY